MSNIGTTIGVLLGGILAVVALGGLVSYFVMLLWNGCLVPALAGVNPISWLQAWGITILCWWLFKSNTYGASK